MYNELIDVLNKWSIDVHNISLKHYDNFIEVLINGHYIFILEKTN